MKLAGSRWVLPILLSAALALGAAAARSQPAPGPVLNLHTSAAALPSDRAAREVAKRLARHRVVALGEGTHGTHEFFETKRALVERLVHDHGFRAFALEASHGRTLALDSAVRLGTGDVRAAVAELGFWIWNTEEMVSMFEALRSWNLQRAPADRVRVFGFDLIHNEPTIQALRTFFRQHFSEYLGALESAVEPLDGVVDIERFSKRPPDDKRHSLRAVQALVGLLEAHRPQLIRSAGVEAFDDAVQHLRVLLRFHETYQQPYFRKEQPDTAAVHRRESRMAANILSAVDGWASGRRMIVWAHNGHISRSQNLGFAPEGYTMILPAMGHYLAQALGRDYHAMALTTGGGESRARVETRVEGTHLSTRPHRLPTPDPTSVEAMLGRWCASGCFVDLSAERWKTWAGVERPMLLLGGLFDETWSIAQWSPSVRLSEHFDSLMYLPRSTPSRPTATGNRPARPVAPQGVESSATPPAADDAAGAEALVQRQLDDYNRREAQAFAAHFAEDAQLISLSSGDILMRGRASIEQNYRFAFERNPALNAALLKRTVHGRFVVDHELVTGLADGRQFNALAIYEVKAGKIWRMWLAR